MSPYPGTGAATTDDEDDEDDDDPAVSQAAAGTLRALAHGEAGAEGVQNSAVGVVGSALDFIRGDSGTAIRSDLTESQADQRLTGVVATDDGGAVVQTDGVDGGVVSTGPGRSRLSDETRARLSYGDSGDFRGWVNMPQSLNAGDAIPITAHVAKARDGAPDRPWIMVEIVPADGYDDPSERAAKKVEKRSVDLTPNKVDLGTVDGLDAGRYVAVLSANGVKVAQSSVITVGSGGGAGASGAAGSSSGSTYRFEANNGATYAVGDINDDGEATAADLTAARNQGILDRFRVGGGSSSESDGDAGGGVSIARLGSSSGAGAGFGLVAAAAAAVAAVFIAR
jgi:hypothetical protein